MKENMIYLLGGHDLEMVEIRKMLAQEGIRYFDRNLKWDAELSSYKDVLGDEHTFIGVERIIDCEQPLNYIEIDHHNEKSHKPSSIEQVAQFLNIQLSWHQQLVASNDHGYIPAMEKMGACMDEIEMIYQTGESLLNFTRTEIDRELANAIRESLILKMYKQIYG